MHSEFEINERPSSSPPAFTLHPIRGVVWAAFWGSPLAAGIVMAINYYRLGHKAAARTTVVIAFAATAALFAAILAIPDDVNIPNSVYFIPQLIIVYGIANSLQGTYIRNHMRHRGTVASAWPSVGIGVLCLPLVLGAILGISILLEPSLGKFVEFGNDEIYCAGDATEVDARKLARVLGDAGLFGSGGASVRLESSSGKYTVSFVLVGKAWDDPEIVEAFRDVGGTLVESGFPAPLTVQLCDELFSTQVTLLIE